MTQTNVSQTGEPSWAAIDAGFMNTPDPITLPMMMAVADQKPICLVSEEVVVVGIKQEGRELRWQFAVGSLQSSVVAINY